MIHETPEEITPLQKRLGELGTFLSILAVGLCTILFLAAVWQKRDVGEMFLTAISLAVAAVPEGLPAVVTIVLALSVSRMAKVHTIVRRLPSVETLGAVNVVCSDKTGTLTKNQMTVRNLDGDREWLYEHFYSAMMQDGESTESSEILQKQLSLYADKMQGMGKTVRTDPGCVEKNCGASV